jgi:hypothetical protein
MTDAEALQDMLKIVEEGGAVLVAGKVHADLPTIQEVGHTETARLKTTSEVRHEGFGLFVADVGDDTISFDGGGAMYRADSFSWCRLVASTEALAAMGYHLEGARAAISSLVNAPQGA